MSVRTNLKRGCRYWLNLVAFACLALFIGLLFLQFVGHPYYLSKGWAHPNSPAVCCSTPENFGWAYEGVSFVTADGLALRGLYILSKKWGSGDPVAFNWLESCQYASVGRSFSQA